jgi:hypothetical protein
MKSLLACILICVASFPALAQNESWNLPLDQQDTTITITIAQARVDTVYHITAQGRKVRQYILDAEHLAARLRTKPLSEYMTLGEIQRAVADRRREIAADLDRLDAEAMGAVEYRQAARTIRARAREYQRVVKKGSTVTE